jgi:flavodoxin I
VPVAWGDWDLLKPRLDDIDLRGKLVTIFGLGDQEGYAHEFVDAIGILHERALDCGADTIGHWSDEGYDDEA